MDKTKRTTMVVLIASIILFASLYTYITKKNLIMLLYLVT